MHEEPLASNQLAFSWPMWRKSWNPLWKIGIHCKISDQMDSYSNECKISL